MNKNCLPYAKNRQYHQRQQYCSWKKPKVIYTPQSKVKKRGYLHTFSECNKEVNMNITFSYNTVKWKKNCYMQPFMAKRMHFIRIYRINLWFVSMCIKQWVLERSRSDELYVLHWPYELWHQSTRCMEALTRLYCTLSPRAEGPSSFDSQSEPLNLMSPTHWSNSYLSSCCTMLSLRDHTQPCVCILCVWTLPKCQQ